MGDHRVHDKHDHTHGPGCGHKAIQHAGHTDYLHDGHLHHVHDGCGSQRDGSLIAGTESTA